MSLPARPLRLLRGLRPVTIAAPEPDAMLLDWLRAEGGHGTREGCGEGDCGACTVVVGELQEGALRLRAVNSCIRPLSSVDGCAVFTVEDLAQPGGALHPAQQAMVDCHGSQCGFCTPGFVMSLFALYHQHGAQAPAGCVSREQAQDALSGNLCRCTGYRPILEAAQTMHALPARPLDTAALTEALHALQDTEGAQLRGATGTAWRPAPLAQALRVRAEAPDALVVAGSTDTGLWINKQHQRPAQTLDLGGVAELGRIRREAGGLTLGAGARLEDAFQALAADHPSVAGFLARFAGLPVRNAGTLGGNIVNGSPIGDSMPLLLALDARLTLASVRGERELPLADFYTGYRRNRLAADELLTAVHVPATPPGLRLGAWKVSKRLEDDISAVCLAVAVQCEGGHIVDARIGVGGMAATCSRAPQAEAALIGQPWSLTALQAGAAALHGEFTPIDDLRASAAYRTAVIGNLLLRLWHETEPGHDRLGSLRALTV